LNTRGEPIYSVTISFLFYFSFLFSVFYLPCGVRSVGKNVIMASSDVSARGMDYPDVTFVLQVGMTDRDQYIHRLGRTARAGKGGNGLLLLAPFEFDYMTRKELADLPLQSVAAEEKLPQQPSALVRFLDC
jgi:ATP-dependent RNA helicase MSS116, mitochondrial